MSAVAAAETRDQEALEWQARIDLAAAHRLAWRQGFSEGIRNHLTLSVPGRIGEVFVLPFGLHWSEVTASCFMVVNESGAILRGKGEVERSTFCLHVPLHCRLPHAVAVFHTHAPYSAAMTRLADPQIRAIGQTEIGLMNSIAYDKLYTGLGYDVEDGERIAGVLGGKSILFMANHGVMVTGRTVASAYERLFYLERACQVQVLALSTGQPLKEIPPDTVQRTQAQFADMPTYYGQDGAQLHFEALKRILDREEPVYKT